jgi:hypothetical protein
MLMFHHLPCIIDLCEWIPFAGFGFTSANGYRLLGSAVMMSCIIELCEWIPFAGFGFTSANGYRLLGSAVMMPTCVMMTTCDWVPFAVYMRMATVRL